ncbi:MgtC/SapB family protein [Spirabiliibacterium falconis]|uniref:MgtC/SapB family protein n=1 Tax=Spirabiliibacterium falconis TaxID=572023 RepID=UPI002E2A2057|nr:MgtC/SapB family protein [Spirabiliibacterium falconis]
MDWVVLGKLLLTALLGGLIGIEREIKRKPVGLKTCVVIAVTTSVLTIVSIHAAEYYASLSNNIRTDPMRLAAQVISGIGFIGGGVILQKNNDVISGITTAAIIWAVAGVGITVGAGFYLYALIASAIIIFILKYSTGIKRVIPKHENINRVMIKLDMQDTQLVNHISKVLHREACDIETISIKEQDEHKLVLTIKAQMPEHGSSYELYKELKKVSGISNIEINYFN